MSCKSNGCECGDGYKVVKDTVNDDSQNFGLKEGYGMLPIPETVNLPNFAVLNDTKFITNKEFEELKSQVTVHQMKTDAALDGLLSKYKVVLHTIETVADVSDKTYVEKQHFSKHQSLYHENIEDLFVKVEALEALLCAVPAPEDAISTDPDTLNIGTGYVFKRGDMVSVEIREECYQLYRGILKSFKSQYTPVGVYELEIGNSIFEYESLNPHFSMWKNDDENMH